MAEDYCPACGQGFLAEVRSTGGTKLPFIGDVTKLNSGEKLVLGVGIAVVLIVGIVLVLTIAGLIFH
jgi:hypothetical protein